MALICKASWSKEDPFTEFGITFMALSISWMRKRERERGREGERERERERTSPVITMQFAL
jgi:hypothetical protein